MVRALPFEIAMAKSQYSNTDTIETEIQLADSGYGQGQVLVNPLHLACLYTAFCNEGNIIKPDAALSGGAGSGILDSGSILRRDCRTGAERAD